MKANSILNKTATKIFNQLIEGLDKNNPSRKIDNTNGSFMPVNIEFLYSCNQGLVYSVTHYFEMNGDLVRDLDMEFLKAGDLVLPLSFQNQYYYAEAMFRDENGKWKVFPKEQRDQVQFANMWMKNIKNQQEL